MSESASRSAGLLGKCFALSLRNSAEGDLESIRRHKVISRYISLGEYMYLRWLESVP